MNKCIEIRGKGEHYKEISFLKGFSIMTIVVMHLMQIYIKSCPVLIKKVSSLGGTGVHVFFLCSGIGLYLSYMRKHTGYAHFCNRRLWKIYVPYMIVIIISALIPFMYEGNHVKALLSHAFLYKMFIAEYEGSFGGHFWFVSTLFQFYLVFIPLCKIKEKMGSKIFCLGAVLLSVCWWVFTTVTKLSGERIWGSFFLQYLWEFAIGMEFAEKLEKGTYFYIGRFSLLIGSIAGLGLTAMAALFSETLKTFNDISALIGYGSLTLLIYSIGIGWIEKIVLFISEISYELYLVHILVFTVVFHFMKVQGNMEYAVGGFSLLCTVAIAYLYHICIKKSLFSVC